MCRNREVPCNVTHGAVVKLSVVLQAQSVHDLSQPLIAQAYSYVEQVQVSVKAVLDTLTETYLLTWVIPQYNSIGSLDIHIHG